MTRPYYRSAFGYDRKQASNEASHVQPHTRQSVGEPDANGMEQSLTCQADAHDADMNTIAERFNLTGKMPENHRVPEFGDYSNIDDFASALAAVDAARDHFMAMPADVRARFGNDPQQFLSFCSVEANFPQMVEMGLAVRREVVEDPKHDPAHVPPGGVPDGKVKSGGGS